MKNHLPVTELPQSPMTAQSIPATATAILVAHSSAPCPPEATPLLLVELAAAVELAVSSKPVTVVVTGAMVFPATVDPPTTVGSTVIPSITVVHVAIPPRALAGMALPTPVLVHGVGIKEPSVAVLGLAASSSE